MTAYVYDMQPRKSDALSAVTSDTESRQQQQAAAAAAAAAPAAGTHSDSKH